jgi:hypothetical protein
VFDVATDRFVEYAKNSRLAGRDDLQRVVRAAKKTYPPQQP